MIDLDRVTKVYPGGGAPAVDAVSLHVTEGEIAVFIGPSGCGKTTLMRMINRLAPITSGVIKVGGKDVMDLEPIELRRSIGYVIQQIGLFPHMTVHENIAVVPKLLEWKKERIAGRVDELLALVGLEPNTFRSRYPRELSGGQAQRVGVARAMAADPPVMLMDEPFGAIDPITREVLQDEFLKIQSKLRKTVIFVTHDIHEAIKLGQKVALLKDGRLVQYGPPVELLARPKNEFVQSFVGTDRALKRLDLLKVKDAMLKHPVHCLAEDGCGPILEYMLQNDLYYLLVTDSSGKLKGYVNIRDLRARNGTVEEVIRPMTLTVRVDQNLKEALSKMLSYDLGIVVAVEEDGTLSGVLNTGTLVSVIGETYDELGGHWGKVTAQGRIL